MLGTFSMGMLRKEEASNKHAETGTRENKHRGSDKTLTSPFTPVVGLSRSHRCHCQGDQPGPCTSYSYGPGHRLGWVRDKPLQTHEGTAGHMKLGGAHEGRQSTGGKRGHSMHLSTQRLPLYSLALSHVHK